MPFKMSASGGKIKLTWSELDGSMDASWTILTEDDESRQLDILEKAIAFVRKQRGEQVRQIQEVETFLDMDAHGIGEKIVMGMTMDDRPNGGPPVSGWAALAAGAQPAIPARSAADGWEYIPADEM